MTHFNMTILIKIWTALTIILLLCFGDFVSAATEKVIWEGQVDQLTVHWSNADIIASDTSTGKVLFSARALAKKDFDEDSSCEQEYTFTLLAVVGKIASIKEVDFLSCKGAAHPSLTTQFTVVNLTKPNLRVKLTDFFAESDLLQALLMDTVIKKALTRATITTPPTSLAEFSRALAEQELEVTTAENGVNECSFALPKDFLTNFVFHHVKNNEVAIRLGLSPVAGACRGTFAQVGVYLPIPNALKATLGQAQTGKAGFLMERQAQLAGKQETKITFATQQATPPKAEEVKAVLTELKEGAIPETDTIRITTDAGVRLRATPNREAEILDKLDKDVIVTATARSKQQDQVGNITDYWYQITSANGKTGWIFGGFTQSLDQRSSPNFIPQGTRVITGEGVRIRTAPNLRGTVIDKLAKGTIVKELERLEQPSGGDYWYLVTVTPRKTGWVSGRFTKPQDTKPREWQGQSGNFKVRWTESDILATQESGKPVFSAKVWAKRAFEQAQQDFLEAEGLVPAWKEEDIFTLLSLVGNIASLKESVYQVHQAIDMIPVSTIRFHRWISVDLSKPDKLLKLSELFSEADILRALLADSFMQKALADTQQTIPTFTTVRALADFLDSAGGRIVINGCGYSLYPNGEKKTGLTNFAFHHVKDNQMAVRINLVAEGCREAQLGIYLPLPTVLKTVFQQAEEGSAGFLMKRQPELVGRLTTIVPLSNDQQVMPVTEEEATVVPKTEMTVKTKAEVTVTTEERITTGSGVRVRAAPALEAKVLSTLKKGVVVKTLARSEQPQKIGGITDYWYQVQLSEEQTGWVFGGLIRPVIQSTVTGSRITTTSLEVRSAPDLQATVIDSLKIGTAVKPTDTKENWYQIELVGSKKGWLAGEFTLPFDAKQRAAVYLKIAQQRLKEELDFSQLIDFIDFICYVKNDVAQPPEMTVELGLSYLLALQKTLKVMETLPEDKRVTPPYTTWLEQQQQDNVISGTMDALSINSQLIWQLHDNYYPLPLTDRIAWLGVEATGDSCDAEFSCELLTLATKEGQYVKFHADGAYVENALTNLTNLLPEFLEQAKGYLADSEEIISSNSSNEVQRSLAVLRASVARTTSAKKASVLAQLDKLIQLLEKKLGPAKKTSSD